MICDYGTLEERKLEIRREDDGQYFDFQFPPQVFKTKTFKNAQELNRQLIRAGIKCYFRRGRLFLRDDYKCSGGSRTVFRCKHRECSARLLYHKRAKQPILEVITFKNLHNHKKSKDPEKAKRQQVNQFIMNLSGKDYEDFRNIKKWMQKFDLSNREALYIVEQLYWVNNTENQILTRLSYEGHTIRRVMDEGQTMLIFMRTDNMRNNYLISGQSIVFDISYDVLRKPSPFGNKYAIGFFYAQDQNLRISLVATCMMAKQSVKNFKKIFQFFLDCVSQDRPPICFVTDEIKTLTIALRQIREERKLDYYHFFSWYHVIENMKPILKQLKNGRNVLDVMCKSMQQFNENMYMRHLEQLRLMLKGHEDIYNQFLSKQGYYCVRRLPQKFQGYAITTLFGNSVNHRTRQCTAYRVHTGRLFYKFIEIQMMLQKDLNKVTIVNTGTLKHYSAEINGLQDKLETKIMDSLVRNYSDAKDCRREQINPITFKIYDRDANEFCVTFSIEYDHWECQCNHLPLIGIPCAHIISVLSEPSIQGAIMYYINTRWIHSKQEFIKEPTRAFISNKRRRP